MTRCTFPDRTRASRRCDRQAVAVYVGSDEQPRCRRHDGRDVRRFAERDGYQRVEVAA